MRSIAELVEELRDQRLVVSSLGQEAAFSGQMTGEQPGERAALLQPAHQRRRGFGPKMGVVDEDGPRNILITGQLNGIRCPGLGSPRTAQGLLPAGIICVESLGR
ncbi:hypothetical protein [Streptomyces sp. NPDC005209]|uniref:hypothetical protein n=1 Tax=Streptomyces sp. NPDC005209 TaxID=3156715 RepID=UPI0033BAEA9A